MTLPTTPPAGLDFASIRQQYPAAFAALIAWFCAGKHFNMGAPTSDTPGEAEAGWDPYLSVGLGKLEAGDFRDEYTLHTRDLFDFFDQAGVYVSVGHMLNRHGSHVEGFFYRLAFTSQIVTAVVYPTRRAAESAAFMAAFGRLEDRLKQEQG